ncbi:MAG: hypothetical protein QXU62_04490 [Thermofilaceae archaeon]
MIAPGETNLSRRDWLLLTIGFALFAVPFAIAVHVTSEKVSTIEPPEYLQPLIERIEPIAPVLWAALLIINVAAIIAAFYILVRL